MVAGMAPTSSAAWMHAPQVIRGMVAETRSSRDRATTGLTLSELLATHRRRKQAEERGSQGLAPARARSQATWEQSTVTMSELSSQRIQPLTKSLI